MHTLISFDISDDKVRYRVTKTLMTRAARVQKSVFEAADLPMAAYLRLRSRIERRINIETDSVRYYRLCQACVERIEFAGCGPTLIEVPKEFTIVGP